MPGDHFGDGLDGFRGGVVPPDAPGATFGEIANTETLPYSIDTTANHDIALGVGYGGTATGGNNVQVLSMTIEVLQYCLLYTSRCV